jgi:hypothetical protein
VNFDRRKSAGEMNPWQAVKTKITARLWVAASRPTQESASRLSGWAEFSVLLKWNDRVGIHLDKLFPDSRFDPGRAAN